MGHPCDRRLWGRLSQCYHHPDLCYHVNRLKAKIFKDTNKQVMDRVSYQKEKCVIVPREEVILDLIGPWKVINGRQIEFNVLTCIDTVSNLVELI